MFLKTKKLLAVLSVMVLLLALLVGCDARDTKSTQENIEHEVEQPESKKENVLFKVVTPPDPNSIPLLVLDAKQKEWMDGVEIQTTVAPGGDPSAMRALLHSKEADFALFNALGGAKNYANGLTDLKLMGVHIWKGVYLLTRENVENWEELNGAKAIAVPGVGTPPQIMALKALGKHKVEMNFGGMGPGLALWTALSKEDSDILAVAAPEPIVSMLLIRQESEGWSNKFKIFADLAQEINPEAGRIPLGGLIMVDKAMLNDANKSEAAKTFIAGFEKSINYVNDPANHSEVSELLVAKWKEVFKQELPKKLFEALLSSGRIGAEYRPAYEVKDEVMDFWEKQFNFKASEEFFYQKGE